MRRLVEAGLVEADGEGLAPAGDCACISATTVEESMPPDRKAPSGTSAIMRPLDRVPEPLIERVGQLAVAARERVAQARRAPPRVRPNNGVTRGSPPTGKVRNVPGSSLWTPS